MKTCCPLNVLYVSCGMGADLGLTFGICFLLFSNDEEKSKQQSIYVLDEIVPTQLTLEESFGKQMVA